MLTFEPHPRAFFSGRPLFRLTPAPLKAALAAALGFDGTLVLPFDRALADRSAEDFVRETLVERLAIRAAVTGYDFHFGKARRGTPQFLAEQGVLHGFSVTIVDAQVEGGEAVSATRIRAALAKGDVTAANLLLGWHFAVAGTIVHGDKRGRELGYPTANMLLDPASELAHGIYAVRLLRADGTLLRRRRELRPPPDLRRRRAGARNLRLRFFRRPLWRDSARRRSRASSAPSGISTASPSWSRRWMRISIDARAILERTPPGALDRRLYEIRAARAG